MAPILFLAVGPWVYFWYFLLLTAALVYCISAPPKVTAKDVLPILVLSTPFLAVLLSQSIRGDLLLRSFDSPSRLLCAIPIYLLIRDKLATGELQPTTIFQALAWASSIALLVLPWFIDDTRTAQYGGRIATETVDTNTLGSYVGILLVTVVMGTWRQIQDTLATSVTWVTPLTLAAYLISFSVGIDILLQTKSRGAWIGFTCTTLALLTVLIILSRRRSKPTALLAAILILLTAMSINTAQLDRVKSIPAEIISWMNTGQGVTSGGIRLNMLQVSLTLFIEQPLAGYGEKGYETRLKEEDMLLIYGSQTLNDMSGAGPHNGIVENILQTGTFGLIASLFLYILPPILFFRRLKRTTKDINMNDLLLRVLGLAFVFQILILQLTTSPNGLRAFASFNALLLALFWAHWASDQERKAT